MRDNKGLSLVELIVVVAIMSALIGLASFSINVMMGTETTKAIQTLDASINKVRMETMSKASAQMKLYVDSSDQAYYIQTTLDNIVQEPIFVGKPDVQISYQMKPKGNGTLTTITLDSGHPLILTFDRSNGAQKLYPEGDNGSFCTEIIVSKGKTKKIILIPETGRHYVEK